MNDVFLRNFPVAEEKEYVLAVETLADKRLYISNIAVDKQGYVLQNMKSLWYSGDNADMIDIIREIDYIRAEHCQNVWDDMVKEALDLDDAEREYADNCPSRKDYSDCGCCGYANYCWA